ncbi:pectate lyase [Roseateles sp. SL47]|uniref:pectate lyase n=1 Tax=Roseateles sp. SL47 TaxID=2995138 RepID=UPI002271B597|nr:pectate lyase [Roseateles sp. SL47]WAC71584.1 pectate lyase [Roseateles sp. SL47]
MNAVEPIGSTNADPYARYNAYQPHGDGGISPGMMQVAQMMQTIALGMALLNHMANLFSQNGGGGSPFSGGSQQQTDPFQQFLQNLQSLFNPQQDGSGADGCSGGGGGGSGGGVGGSSPGQNDNNGSSNPWSRTGNKHEGSNEGDRGVSPPEDAHGGGKPSTKPDTSPTSPTSPTNPTSPGKTDAPTTITPSTRIPEAKGTVVVHEPIVVKAGQTFDGGGKLYQAGPELGDGGQSETQKPVFQLEPGATLQNVQVQGGDGVHANGDATLKNVWWKDVGEDAFTLKKPGHVTVEGGGAYHASDKVFQINASGSISINGFHAEDFDKLVRQNGGKDFPLTVKLSNITTKDAGEALVRTDSPQARIYLSNVDPSTVKNDVLAPSGALVEGAVNQSYKPYTG